MIADDLGKIFAFHGFLINRAATPLIRSWDGRWQPLSLVVFSSRDSERFGVLYEPPLERPAGGYVGIRTKSISSAAAPL